MSLSRRVLTAPPFLAILLVLASCGDGVSANAGAGTGAENVNNDRLVESTIPWDSLTLDSDGTGGDVTFVGGECGTFDVEVQDDRSEVVVSLVWAVVRDGKLCTLGGEIRTVHVDFGRRVAPLEVVDGACINGQQLASRDVCRPATSKVAFED